jgi:membrane-associated phospholipid phosphatase
VYRLEGLSAAIRELVPPVVVEAFAALTTLGDPPFLVGVVAVLYWLVDDRSATGRLVAYTLLAVAVTVTLKEGLALPRPPAGVRAVAVGPGSHGVPSGHAVGAVAVYGGLAVVFGRLRRPQVVAVLVGLVGLIALSRVVIGVHYLGDVLAGLAVGSAVLLGLYALPRPGVATLVAAGIALVGAFVTGGGTDAVFVLGASVGAGVAFSALDPAALPVPETVPEGGAVLVLGSLLLAGGYLVVTAAGSPAVVFGASALLVACTLVLPAVLGVAPPANPVAE